MEEEKYIGDCESKLVGKEPELLREINRLKKQASAIKEVVNLLGAKLKPVMQPECPKVEDSAKDESVNTEVGKELRSVGYDLSYSKTILTDYVDRLEV